MKEWGIGQIKSNGKKFHKESIVETVILSIPSSETFPTQDNTVIVKITCKYLSFGGVNFKWYQFLSA